MKTRLITTEEKEHIELILNTPIKVDEDYQKLIELVGDINTGNVVGQPSTGDLSKTVPTEN